MKRYDKTKTENDGYLPIYANNMFTMVNISFTVNSMKAFQGFCACNSLQSGRFAKLQGGYYILTNSNLWEFVCVSLNSLTFETIFDKLKNL